MRTSLQFRLNGGGHQRGDDREYDVFQHGRHIGVVANDYLPSSKIGEPVPGFCFNSNDGKVGMGRTRAGAVMDAFREDA